MPSPYPKQCRWTGPSCTPGACFSPSSACSSRARPEPGGTQSPCHPPEHGCCLGLQRTPGGFLRGWAALGNTRCSLSASGSGGGSRAPSHSDSGSPVTSPCCSALRFNSISGRKQQQLQGNGDCATEVTSQVFRLQKHCSTWFPCKHSFFLLIGSVCVVIPINL